MKNNLTEIVFILDRSGSMSGLEKETIGGYNSLIKKQRREKGEAIISTVLFDNQIEVLHDRVNFKDINDISEKDYFVRGSTALLDAVGSSIAHMRKVYRYTRKEDRPSKTLFVITTDGYENASREYDYKKIRDMIKHQKDKYDWEFLFLGANIDAVGEASKFGIDASKAVKYECDSKGTELNYAVLNEAVCNVRMGNRLDASWKSKIESDYKKRHK